ncbi:MAG: hypothetical protein CL678_10260 [Bdellovibrionaceae bacterium]|nr:hypothetical protein [Pseudobdellovibrionaceae bacterium]|tara:strand:- start:2086 stop:2973 length:888 start_codon:yes stop_codon:yes gene_type:complete
MAINCFNVRNQTSDYLDGTLPEFRVDDIKQHIRFCEECKNFLDRCDKISKAINAIEVKKIPIPMHKDLFQIQLPLSGSETQAKEPSRWQRTPWFLKSGIEASGIALTILIIVAAVPRIKSNYLTTESNPTAQYREYQNEVDLSPELPTGIDKEGSGDEDFDPIPVTDYEEKEKLLESIDSEEIKVGNGEVWRFHIKTDSPQEIRPHIKKALISFHLPKNDPGIEGFVVPGGIQFNLLVNKSIIPEVKKEVQKIAIEHSDSPSNSSIRNTFTWYKNKSRKRISPGKARLVVWLSQI